MWVGETNLSETVTVIWATYTPDIYNTGSQISLPNFCSLNYMNCLSQYHLCSSVISYSKRVLTTVTALTSIIRLKCFSYKDGNILNVSWRDLTCLKQSLWFEQQDHQMFISTVNIVIVMHTIILIYCLIAQPLLSICYLKENQSIESQELRLEFVYWA